MQSLTKNIVINAPLEKIWGLLADVNRTPEWVDGVQESERTGALCDGVGMRWRERCLFERQNIDMEHEITEWQPRQKAVIRSVLPMNGSMTRSLQFAPTPNGIEVSIQVEWDLGIAGMLLGEKKIREMLEASFEKTLEQWKVKTEL